MPAPVSLIPHLFFLLLSLHLSLYFLLHLSLHLSPNALAQALDLCSRQAFLFVCFFSPLLGRVCTGVGYSLIENLQTH